jgi:branched-chain amino acid transport system ATP-binding protein
MSANRPIGVALACEALDAGYARNAVVRDFSLEVHHGEVVALLGPNGAGKTTLLLTMAGLIPWLAGSIRIGEATMSKPSPVRAARRGLVLVPDDRSLFTTLTVRENLVLGQRRHGRQVDDILDFFPMLRNRLNLAAGRLSGGEQQMLAIGRAMMLAPKVLLIDELSMGLAPVIVENLLPIVRAIADETGAGVVLVEQHVQLALGIADRAVVLVHGTTALAGTAEEMRMDMPSVERAYLGE